MKISEELQLQAVKQRHTNMNGKKSFDRIIQSQTNKLKELEIHQLMKEISQQGDRIARYRSLRELVKFKRLVKNFLNETVTDGLDLGKSYPFHMDGQMQPLTIVKEIDKQLIELTEELMNQEKKPVQLLKMIGEIKGLLVNLYM